MYLSYEEYQDMGGTLDETAFDQAEFDAETYIDWYTFDRLKKETVLPEKVKRCIFALIKLLDTKNGLLNREGEAVISHQANDGVTTTYAVLSGNIAYDQATKEIGSCIKRYLSGIKTSDGQSALYRG